MKRALNPKPEAKRTPPPWAEEKCQKIVKEQEFKIRKLKEKMAAIPPTKKNKAHCKQNAAPQGSEALNPKPSPTKPKP